MNGRRRQKVWENLVAFANSDPPDLEPLKDSILWYLPWPIRCEGQIIVLPISDPSSSKSVRMERFFVRKGYLKHLIQDPAFANARKIQPAVRDILSWLVEGDAHPRKHEILSFIDSLMSEIKFGMKLARNIPETYNPRRQRWQEVGKLGDDDTTLLRLLDKIAFPFPRDIEAEDYQEFVDDARSFNGLRAGIKGKRK